MTKAVAISLKIPDNTAYTAAVALRRLGVHADRIERSEIYLFDDAGDVEALAARIMTDERIFNPNKHRLTVLDEPAPRAGELWIVRQSLDSARDDMCAVAWRLYDAQGQPLRRDALEAAAERLLCNPAIERAVYSKRDNR